MQDNILKSGVLKIGDCKMGFWKINVVILWTMLAVPVCLVVLSGSDKMYSVVVVAAAAAAVANRSNQS